MRCQIVRAKVSFDLNDPARVLLAAAYVDQMFSQQFAGDQNRVPVVKGAGQFFHDRLLGGQSRFQGLDKVR